LELIVGKTLQSAASLIFLLKQNKNIGKLDLRNGVNRMANKHQVLEIIAAHPDWNARRVANELGCMPEYVRATADRNHVKMATKGRREPAPVKTLLALGRAAFLAGLTVDKIANMSGPSAQRDAA
jgi:hypothetical protein